MAEVEEAFIDYYKSLLGQVVPIEVLDRNFVRDRAIIEEGSWADYTQPITMA